MQLKLNGVNVTVHEPEIERIVLQHIRGAELVAECCTTTPRIGDEWPGHGGIYAGVMRGRDGGHDYHLIVGPDIDASTWGVAMKAAAEISQAGFSDYSLPFRAEQALQFANVPELFQKDRYWSCEQPAADSYDAWCQYFGNGNQYHWLQYHYHFRARAVRRLPL